MNASIILPLYKPDKKILGKILGKIKQQKFSGKIEVLPLELNQGFSKQINYGIDISKYEIIVLLPQDCIPSGNFWLRDLLEPLKDKKNVASVSKVIFPEKFWKVASVFTKSLLVRERGTIVSLLDGKGTAYRKSALDKVGRFDEKTFRTAGEDLDMYLKIQKEGKIAYPSCEIVHYHPTNLFQRLKKVKQYANGNAAVLIKHGLKFKGSWKIIIKSLPLIGFLMSIMRFPIYSNLKLFLPYILIAPLEHVMYLQGFWKGIIQRRQTI